jgi:beta-lactamase regulating signal transducer with metallopeptidase domain
MEKVFSLVLNASLYGSIVGVIIFVMKKSLNNRLNSTWHYLIWSVLILKLIIPFGPESSLSLFNIVPKIEKQAINNNMTYKEESAISTTEINTVSTIDKPIMQSEIKTPGKENGLENVIAYIWALGVSIMLLWILSVYYSFNRRLKKGVVIEDMRIMNIFEACKTKMKVKKDIKLILQETVNSPSLLGIIRPRILLCKSTVELTDKQLEYILLHELAHFKRRDGFVNYLLIVLQIIHWFNPLLWFCFECIRQDMEAAADEKVLNILDNNEYKEYGAALLAVLESFRPSMYTPKLIGMVDNKKNMKKRIKLIKMISSFKRRNRTIFVIGVISTTIVSYVVLTNGVSSPTQELQSGPYSAKTLLKYKTSYVGNNSKVVNIINNLAYGDFPKEVSLQTKNKPYGISVTYDFSLANMNTEYIKPILYNNAVILFALVDNVDTISLNVKGITGTFAYNYKRDDIQDSFDEKLGDYSKSEKEFEDFLSDLSFKVFTSPKMYTPTMSNTPGIHIVLNYVGNAEKVRYSTDNGILFRWTDMGPKEKILELPINEAIYWSPLESYGNSSTQKDSIVTITILDRSGKEIDERKVKIKYDNYMYYPQ